MQAAGSAWSGERGLGLEPVSGGDVGARRHGLVDPRWRDRLLPDIQLETPVERPAAANAASGRAAPYRPTAARCGTALGPLSSYVRTVLRPGRWWPATAVKTPSAPPRRSQSRVSRSRLGPAGRR